MSINLSKLSDKELLDELKCRGYYTKILNDFGVKGFIRRSIHESDSFTKQEKEIKNLSQLRIMGWLEDIHESISDNIQLGVEDLLSNHFGVESELISEHMKKQEELFESLVKSKIK